MSPTSSGPSASWPGWSGRAAGSSRSSWTTGRRYRHWLAAAQDAERGGYHSDTFVGMVVSARKPDRASTQSSRGDGELVRLEAVRGDQEVVRGHVGHRDRDQGGERVQQLE